MSQFKSILVEENPSINGLKPIISVGSKRKPLIPINDPSKIIIFANKTQRVSLLNWRECCRLIRYTCGHLGPKSFLMHVYGVEVKTIMPGTRRCPRCELEHLTQHAFRCCLCGLAVLPGDPVAVYSAASVKQKDFKFKVLDDRETALGCMRWDCCPSGGFFAGHWTENGFKGYDFSKS